MKSFAGILVLIFSGIAMSGDAVDSSDDAYVSAIDISRLGVIMEFTQNIWLKMRSASHSGTVDDPAKMSSALRLTVWEYNALRERMCSDRFMVEESCRPPFIPKWAHESPRVIPSMQELSERQGELDGVIVPLWDAACARLHKVMSEDDAREYCSIE